MHKLNIVAQRTNCSDDDGRMDGRTRQKKEYLSTEADKCVGKIENVDRPGKVNVVRRRT